MTNDPEQMPGTYPGTPSSLTPPLGFDPVTGQPLPRPVPEQRRLLAPFWHTVLIVILVLGNSLGSAMLASRITHGTTSVSEQARMVQYSATIGLELFLLFLVWVGFRLNQTKMSDVIGGRWNRLEDFLLDLAIGFACWIVAYATIVALSFAVGLAKTSQLEDSKKLASMIAPHTVGALLLFIALSITAGFVEEVIFRGYLQKQIGALSGNVAIGLLVSALIFGAGHGYEGPRRMALIFVLGLIFGCVALLRRSLRPGMIAHALFDSFQGIILFIGYRMGMLQH